MTLKRKKLVTNIVFYAVIALIYGFVIFLLITKFNGGVIYVFNNRYDVVLTDSMSEKNENHLDFLEGTSQIQAFDLVKSEKIQDDTEIKEKDVVLFRNPDLNNATVMHRVVRVIKEGDILEVNDASLKEFHSIKCIELSQYSSSITLTKLDVKKITLEIVSPVEYDKDYSFNIGGAYYASEVAGTQVDDYYKYTITCVRPSTAPMVIAINRANSLESYITSVSFERKEGQIISLTSEEFVETSDEPYRKYFNEYYLYEIRGDKAKDADGIFERDYLISKVNGVIPKMGYFVRFVTSLPGVLMFIGLGVVVSVGSYFYNKAKEKEIKEQAASLETNEVKAETEVKHEESNNP